MNASVCKLQQYLFCLNMLLNILITQNSLCQIGKQWFINIRLFKGRVYIKQKCATYTGYSYCQNPAVSSCLATAVFTSLWHSQHKCSISLCSWYTCKIRSSCSGSILHFCFLFIALYSLTLASLLYCWDVFSFLVIFWLRTSRPRCYVFFFELLLRQIINFLCWIFLPVAVLYMVKHW